MKIHASRGGICLATDFNGGPMLFKPSKDAALPDMPKGFTETACGRTVGGAPVDGPLGHVTCLGCKGSLPYEQARTLQEMFNEG